jgi:hypothetical protein
VVLQALILTFYYQNPQSKLLILRTPLIWHISCVAKHIMLHPEFYRPKNHFSISRLHSDVLYIAFRFELYLYCFINKNVFFNSNKVKNNTDKKSLNLTTKIIAFECGFILDSLLHQLIGI